MGFLDSSVSVEIVAGNALLSGKHVTITKGREKGSLSFNTGIFKPVKELRVVAVEWQEGSRRSAGKAAAGAIIGGVLTGGIGLLAGAAIGGRKRDNSIAIIALNDGQGQEQLLHIRCKPKQYEDLQKMLY